MSVSLYGNVFSSVDMTNTTVLREVAKSGNLKQAEKTKIVRAIDKLEKEDEKSKQPALTLRAMYGNDD